MMRVEVKRIAAMSLMLSAWPITAAAQNSLDPAAVVSATPSPQPTALAPVAPTQPPALFHSRRRRIHVQSPAPTQAGSSASLVSPAPRLMSGTPHQSPMLAATPVVQPTPTPAPAPTAMPTVAATQAPVPAATVAPAAPSPTPQPVVQTPAPAAVATPSPYKYSYQPPVPPPDAPRIIEIDLTDRYIHSGILQLRVVTDPSVVSVIVRSMGHEFAVPQQGGGIFMTSNRIPSIPFFLKGRTLWVDFVASRQDGHQTVVSLPVILS